jgi:hypothetical protein
MYLENQQMIINKRSERGALGVRNRRLDVAVLVPLWRDTIAKIDRERTARAEGLAHLCLYGMEALGPTGELVRLGRRLNKLTAMEHMVQAIDMETIPAPSEESTSEEL